MSRHTLNDGITPDQLITLQSFDEWWKTLAPRDKLVGRYYREEITFEEYVHEYKNYLQIPSIQAKTQELTSLALKRSVTILCVEPTAEHCHRRILAEACTTLEPRLIIQHR
jgi:uncharacterized protein YeaO (DUF488 family)